MRHLACLVLAAAAICAAGCSKNNLGDLFKSPYQNGDPTDIGFGDPDENGAFDLQTLEAGAIFRPGGPEVAAVFPEDGSLDVDVDSFVLLRFNESLGANTAGLAAGIQIQKTDGQELVQGAFSFVEGSAHRLVVFQPAVPLEDETEYEVVAAATLVDAQGEAVAEGGTVSTFTTGTAGAASVFDAITPLILPEDAAENVSVRAPVLVFFTEPLNPASVADELGIEDQGNDEVAGELSFPTEYGDRLLVFTPDADMPAGERIDVVLGRNIENADGDELGADVQFSFNTVGFPRVTAITFDAGDPLIALPGVAYAGRVLDSNQHQIKTTVTTAGSGRSGRLVLFFWDESSDKAIIIVDESDRRPGDVSYTVDLMPELNDALQDGTITVGAYTEDIDGSLSPVGPADELPLLRKDTANPELVSLGPPFGAAAGNSALLLEVGSAGVHGRASEDLFSIVVTVNVDGTPQVLNGLVFFSMEFPAGSGIESREVTRGNDHLFITESLAGIDPAAATRGPFPVTEIVLTDLVGNVTTLIDPAGASVDYRGFASRAAGAAGELEVLCCDAVTLRPIPQADVIVDPHNAAAPQDPPLSEDRLGAQTGPDGRAVFTVSAMPFDHITVTAVRTGYELVSLLGIDEPSAASPLRVSLPMQPESGASSDVSLFITNASDNALPRIFVGGNRLETGTNDVLLDAGVDPTDPADPTELTVGRTKLQFLEAMGVEAGTPEDEYQWAWSNPFVADGAAVIEAVLFFDSLLGVDGLTTQVLETSAFPASYLADAEARLVARLNGFTGTLPLGVDRTGQDFGGQLAFNVPMPPSLFVNERLTAGFENAAVDPPYEVVIEPALGPVAEMKDPDQVLLEQTLSFEVEGIQASPNPRIFRSRIPYAQANIGVPQSMVFPESGGAAVELFVLFIDTMTLPARVQWNATLAVAGSDGAYILHLENTGRNRGWTVYVPAAPHAVNDEVLFPDLSAASLPPGFTPANSFSDFDSTAEYAFHAEAFAVPGFNLEEGFFAEIDRSWTLYWRSETATQTLNR